ncbi:MAG: flagellar motor protein MotA [Pseudomonadota bacterium]
MSRPQRYLVRMILFLLAVAVVAAALYAGLRDAFLANPALNGVILGCLLVGVAFTFRSVWALRPEIAWIQSYQAQLAGHGTVPDLPETRLLAPMARMFGERQGRLSLSAMSMRSLLDGIAARLDEGRDITRYLIGLLIFLGLLGTFWGLLKTIGAVGMVIDGLSVEGSDLQVVFSELQEGLRSPLDGMGTAFSSSLFGLGSSLILGFLELQASQAQNRFYNELEDWLSGVTRLSSGALAGEGEASVPAYLQALMEQTAENLDSLQRTMAAEEENRRQANASLNSLVERLTTLTDQMRAEQTLMVRIGEGQMELRPLISRLADMAERGGFGIDEQSQHYIRNIDTYLRRILEDQAAGRNQMVSEIRSEIKLLARTIAALAEE